MSPLPASLTHTLPAAGEFSSRVCAVCHATRRGVTGYGPSVRRESSHEIPTQSSVGMRSPSRIHPRASERSYTHRDSSPSARRSCRNVLAPPLKIPQPGTFVATHSRDVRGAGFAVNVNRGPADLSGELQLSQPRPRVPNGEPDPRGVPFEIPATGNNVVIGGATAATATAKVVTTVPVNVAGVTVVNTLINTVGGSRGREVTSAWSSSGPPGPTTRSRWSAASMSETSSRTFGPTASTGRRRKTSSKRPRIAASTCKPSLCPRCPPTKR